MKNSFQKVINVVLLGLMVSLLSGCASFAQQRTIKIHCAESRLLITDLMQSSKNRNTMLPTGETCPREVV
jgi:hypothetical protein